MPKKVIFEEEYTGPRWTFGLRYRPLWIGAVPDGWIVGSHRYDKEHYPQFPHGLVDYPRQLTQREIDSYELEFVEHKEGEYLGTPPSIIYLQWGVPPDPEFGVTWCFDQINDSDVEYILASKVEILTEALKRCRTGYYNMMDFNVHPSRSSLKSEIKHIDEALKILEASNES